VRIVAWPAPLLVACWTSAAPPPATTVADASDGTCVIRDRDVSPIPSLQLAIDGAVFAVVGEKLTSVELTVRDPRSAMARLETEHVVLEGELDLTETQVRPRAMMHDGWVEIAVAHVERTSGEVATLAVTLPEPVLPRTLAVEVACSALTLAPADGEAGATGNGDQLELHEGVIPLLRTSGAGVVARVVVRKDDWVFADLLERRHGMVKLRLAEHNAVVGWVAASATRPTEVDTEVMRGGLIGSLGVSTRPTPLRCAAPVAVYVHAPARGTVRVGTIKPKTAIQPLAPLETASTELEIDLDSGNASVDAATLTPFVRVADLTGCQGT
jgi:hypothetical protein